MTLILRALILVVAGIVVGALIRPVRRKRNRRSSRSVSA